MNETIINVITMLGSIGTFTSAVIALAKMLKVAETVKFKPEKLYGKEAEERYNELLKRIPEGAANAFGPDEYKGGAKLAPQFEMDRFYFDRQTMPPEWEKINKTIHYYYEANGKTMVRGWRL